MTPYVRFRSARPSDRLAELRRFYVDGLVVGDPSGLWQAEFIRERASPAPPVPSREHLLVFYVESRDALIERAAAMDAAGWARTTPANPYWSRCGVAYVDPDGYEVVIAVPPGR